MMRRPTALLLIASGLFLALVLAFVVSPLASSSPDGLERVAIDEGFEDTATEHAVAAGPLADYGVRGVDGDVSTGLAGIIGVAITFGVAGGVLLAVRSARQHRHGRPAAA